MRFAEAIAPFVDGIYYVITEAGEPELRDLVYSDLMRARDAEILNSNSWSESILHLHTAVLDFDHFCEYPVKTLHWDETKLGISMRDGQRRFPGIVSGGISWSIDGWNSPGEIEKATRAACKEIDTNRFLMSSGCVIPYRTPEEQILTFRNTDC